MSALRQAAAASFASVPRDARAFDLADDAPYQRWRAAKFDAQPQSADELVVDVADPRALTPGERSALLERCARANMAVYRSMVREADRELPRALGRQLGLQRLDTNWLADEDGISRITVSDARDERGGFIPYTDRPIRWHTDGYYHPQQRRILGMILHCVQPAAAGGESALLDHDMAYIALRDADPRFVQALMAPDAMTIPARSGEDGEARAAQSGPVFEVDAASGALHMRYTARTRSIEWKTDSLTREALDCLERFLASDAPCIFRLRLEAGMGVVANNVLHEREGFRDDPQRPRLLYRARYLDRVRDEEGACRSG